VVVRFDGELFTDQVLASPWDLHGHLRELAPVVWLSNHNAWATGRDEIVREVLIDSERFCSSRGVGLYDVQRGDGWKPSAILELDPPDHDGPRRVMHRLLSPRALREMRHDFETTARTIVDDAVTAGEIDGIADLAFRFPFTVLPDLVGLGADGREHLPIYSRMYFNTRVPGTARAAASLDEVEARGSATWIRDQCRRDNLRPGAFGQRLYDAADSGEISHETAEGLVRSFLGASIDTTVLVLGTVLHQLALHPDALRSLRGDPARIQNAFDEALRWAPAAALIGRTVARPTELAGVALEPGQKIVCLITAANRDPRRWDNPDRFDVDRQAGGHLGFGVGRHFCVGHALARLEAEVLITELVNRVDTIELTGEPEPDLVNWLVGLRTLPLRLS
jgi:cytochrome P450